MRRSTPLSFFPIFSAAVFLLLAAVACTNGPSSDAEAADTPPPAAAPPAAPLPGSPDAEASAPPAPGGEDLGMVSSRGQRVGSQGSGTASSGNGIAFTLPESWKEETPSSSMRMAQAAIPGPGGDGQLTVFFFGVGGGGGVEANLQRWAGQVQADAEPVRETFDAEPFKIHYLEVGGTILPSQMGTGPTTPQPDHRLMGAVVEGPGGPWFFKATGPDATLAAQRDAFKKMLRELKSEV